MKAAMAHLQLHFVGSAGRQTQLEQRALRIPDLRLRPYLLFNYQAIRHALGHLPEGVSAPDLPSISALVKRTAITTARHVADDTAECFAQASDTANVRDSAWSDEHAQVEGAAQDSEMNEAHVQRIRNLGELPATPSLLCGGNGHVVIAVG